MDRFISFIDMVISKIVSIIESRIVASIVFSIAITNLFFDCFLGGGFISYNSLATLFVFVGLEFVLYSFFRKDRKK